MGYDIGGGCVNAEVDVLLDPAVAVRVRAVHWTREGRLIIDADGSSKIDSEGPTGETARRALFERRQRLGADRADGFDPLTELRFRLAAAPEVGEFTLATPVWGFLWDNAASRLSDELASFVGKGQVLATLKIEPVSFVAKNGPMKGETVSYNKPVLSLKRLVPAAE